ncbi:MAG: MATE family efflux transporter, partial [Tissierellia bacterium]|nr:MATE family efflux transporter [Tissierellia bacterium]
ASRIALTIGIIGGALIFIFNKPMVNFFIQSKDEPAVIIQSMTYMKYVAFSMPLMGMFSVFQGIFQGAGNTKYSMAMEVGRLWAIRLPMILIFKNFSSFGPTGIWFSMSVSNLIVCLYGLWVYKTYGWNRKTLSSIIL